MSRYALAPFVALALLCGAVACSDDASSPSNHSSGTNNSTTPMDAGRDSSPTDVTDDTTVDADTGNADMGDDSATLDMSAVTGFGEISGDCGDIDMIELMSSQPFLFVNQIDFADDAYDESDFEQLSQGGQEIINDGNAGGSSLLSEVFAYEVLERCEMASLLKTETEIVYSTQSKITDLLVQIDGLKIGVSVTRAVSFPRDTPYLEQAAQDLMEKKLGDILLSSMSVAPEDAWTKQILHVLVDRPEHLPVIESALENIDPNVRADTVVILTVTEGADDPIY